MDFKEFLKLKPDLLRSIAEPDAIYQSTIIGDKSDNARAIVAERENVDPNSLKYRSELAQQADAALFGTAATAGVAASGSIVAPALKVAIAQYAAPAANFAASLATKGMVYDMTQKTARILFGDDAVDDFIYNTMEPATMFMATHPLEISNAIESLSSLKNYAQIMRGKHNMKRFKKLATAYVNDPEYQEYSAFSKPEVRELYLNEYMPKGITPKTFDQAYQNAMSNPDTATELLNNPGSMFSPNNIHYLESSIQGYGAFPKGKKGGKLYPEDIAKLQEYVDKLALKQTEESSVSLFNITPKSWMDLHPQKNDLIPANVKRTSTAVIDRIISSSRANINNGDISVRPEEYPSIRRYTGGSYQLNTYFGNRGKSPTSISTPDFVQFARGISKESRVYPIKTEGTLLRGLTDSEIQLMLDSYFNKSPYKPNTHMSTTVDPKSSFVTSGLRSVAAIQQKTPVPYIAPLSYYPHEKEVLIPRGMQYNVTGVRTFKSPDTGRDLLFFTLKEIYKPK